jgi:acyl carrier protein
VDQITKPETLKLLSNIFEEPVANLSSQVMREEIAGWDSMGSLTLMAELDERFGILLNADEARQLVRIEDVFQLLRRHGVFAE